MADSTEGKRPKSVLNTVKSLLVMLLIISALFMGVWISIDNPQPVILTLAGFPTPSTALGVVVTFVLLAGVVVGFLLSLLPTIKVVNENLSLKRKLKRREKELESLRKAPVKSALSSSR